VRFVFRNFAFLGPASLVAANATECANAQRKFWEMHDYLYKNQPDESDTSMYTTSKLTAIAKSLGLNSDQFKSCLSTDKFNSTVEADNTYVSNLAQNNPNVFPNGFGTPTFVIGKTDPSGTFTGTVVQGAEPFATFQQIIDALLK
jgi:protein-disulfide isomerase